MDRLARISAVVPLGGYRVRLGFTDGSEREVDLEPYLRGPIFEPHRATVGGDMRDPEPPTQTVQASQAGQPWSQLLDQVARRETRVVVEEDGVAIAAIMSAQDLERLQLFEEQQERDLATLRASQEGFKDELPDEFERQIALALAIEPQVNLGSRMVRMLPDGWTAETVDGSLSAHYEHTVAITHGDPWILTEPDPADLSEEERIIRQFAAEI